MSIDRTQYLVQIPAVNRSGVRLEPFAVVRLSSEESDGRRAAMIPNNDNMLNVFFVGNTSVEPGDNFEVTYQPIRAAYPVADGGPTFMQEIGVQKDSQQLRKDKKGFLVIGGYDKQSAAVIRVGIDNVGGASPCKPSYVLFQFVDEMQCDTFGNDFVTKFKSQLFSTGCGDSTFTVKASGTVTNSKSEPVEAKEIQGNTALPNDTPIFKTIATSKADGTWTGYGSLTIDVTSSTPDFYVEFKLSGATPSSRKYYSMALQVAGYDLSKVDFQV